MTIQIFGQNAGVVTVDGRDVQLLDVDEKSDQLHIRGPNGEQWIALQKARFHGKPFAASDIGYPQTAAA